MSKIRSIISPWLTIVTVLAWVFCAFANPSARCAEAVWLTGAPLRAALAQNVGISWVNIPLHEALAGLSKTQRVAVLIDRGVDPDQKVQIAVENLPLSDAMAQIAARAKIGFSMLGPVAYFGPRATAWRLQTVAALRKGDVMKLPLAARSNWMRMQAWKWNDLATPRDLLKALAEQNNLQISALDQIPHDLWAAADLPPLDLSDRLTLLLAQFELTFEIASDGNSIQLVAMPDKPKMERTFAIVGNSQVAVLKVRDVPELSDVELRVDGNKLWTRGRFEDLESIGKLLSGSKAPRAAGGERRNVYTLRAEEPVEKLLSVVVRQLGMELELNRTAIETSGISLSKKVSLDVKEVSADELLHAILDPAGLAFERQGNTLVIKPK